jgi:Zn-dependent protease
MPIDVIFAVLILIFSVILHEVAHGYMAQYLGDPTAKLAGRLTLNPIKHIDPVGTIALPLLLTLFNSSILIGYAKPVPYNPYNLRHKYGEALVAGAGPAVNIGIALLFGLIIRFFGETLAPGLFVAFQTIVFINIFLAIFNLLPIPPLDGSKVFSAFLPGSLGRVYDGFRENLERLGMLTGVILLLLIFSLLAPLFVALVRAIFSLITGYGY